MRPDIRLQGSEHVERFVTAVGKLKKTEPARITGLHDLPGIFRIRVKKDRNDGRLFQMFKHF